MADFTFNAAKVAIGSADISFAADTFKLLLVTSSYTPDQDAHDFRNDITNEVANGNGYTTGGATLTGVSISVDNSGNRAIVEADDVTWSSSTITARRAILYKSRGGASSADEVIFCYDFSSDKSSTNGNFTVAWTDGIPAVIT